MFSVLKALTFWRFFEVCLYFGHNRFADIRILQEHVCSAVDLAAVLVLPVGHVGPAAYIAGWRKQIIATAQRRDVARQSVGVVVGVGATHLYTCSQTRLQSLQDGRIGSQSRVEVADARNVRREYVRGRGGFEHVQGHVQWVLVWDGRR